MRDMLEALATELNASPGATMSDLAAAAGVSRATLHRRFPSREDLLVRLAEDAANLTKKALNEAHLNDSTAHEACKRLVSALVPLGSRFAFLLREGAWLDEHPTVAATTHAVENAIHQLITRGREAGEFRIDLPPSFQTRLVLAAVFTAWEAVQAGELGSKEAPQAATTALLSGIGTTT